MDARQAPAARTAASAAAASGASTSPFAPTSTPFIPPPAQPNTSAPSQHVPSASGAAHAALHAVPQQPEMVNACETLINVSRSLNARPVYHIQRVGGEDHQPLFHASVELFPQGYVAKGVGRSKMASRRDAASNMLRQIYAKTVHQSAAMPSVSAAVAPQPVSQPQVNVVNPSSYPLQSRSFPSNYASYSQPAYPSMSQSSVLEQPPVGSQPYQTVGQQPQLLPHAQHPQYRQSQSPPLPPHAFPPHQHELRQQPQPEPQPPPQLPRQSQLQPQSQLPLQQQQQPVQDYQLRPQQSLVQQQPFQRQSSFNPIHDQRLQPPQQEEQPMFYVDRSPDSDLERELEEEEEQQKQQQEQLQQQRNPVETTAVHNAIPPAPPPTADTATPSVTAPSNITSPPITASSSVPMPTAPLAYPQEVQPSIAVAATPTAVGTTKSAAPSASVGRAHQVGPTLGDASTPNLPSAITERSTVPVVEKARDNVQQAPMSVQVAGSTTKEAGSQSHPDTSTPETSRVPQLVPQAPAPLPVTLATKLGSSGITSAMDAPVPPKVEPFVASTIKRASPGPESDPAAPLTLKRKHEGDASKPNGDEDGSIAMTAEPLRKKAKGTSSDSLVRLDFHVLCILDEQVRKSLLDLIKANLLIRPHIHLFSATDVTTSIQLASDVSVPVTSFDQNVCEQQELSAMALAFEAGSLSNDLWVERAKHLAKGLPGTLMPRMIILSDNPLFQAFAKKGVIDIVDPKDDLAKYASEILQQSPDSREMAME